MNYQKHYDSLIRKASKRTIQENIYTERHHIVPVCLGGSDEDTNIVVLTPEEHYVAHQLLVKVHPSNSKLIYAAMMMVASSKLHGARNNKCYGWLKIKFYENHPAKNKETIEKILNHKNTKERNRRNSEKLKGPENPSKAKDFAMKIKSSEGWKSSHAKALESARKASLGNSWGSLAKFSNEERERRASATHLKMASAIAIATRMKIPFSRI